MQTLLIDVTALLAIPRACSKGEVLGSSYFQVLQPQLVAETPHEILHVGCGHRVCHIHLLCDGCEAFGHILMCSVCCHQEDLLESP